MINKIRKYFQRDIWEINESKLSAPARFFVGIAKIVTLAVRGFIEDKCSTKSSALTFYSLLSVVPIFAMVFGIAKGFGLDEKLRQQILLTETAANQKEVINWVLAFADSMLQTTKGGLIAGIGVVVLLWSVMGILGNIERAFNDIWEVNNDRSILRKFTDYMAIMILAPILLISSSSITVFISTTVEKITEEVEVVDFFDPLFNLLLNFSPYFIIWAVFVLLYLIMPNTKVSFKAALVGGIIAGTCFQIFEWIYINFQVGVAKYNAIYGSFAALPLFLVWLQTSWNLVLFGAEIAYAKQNYHAYDFESSINNLSFYYRKVVAVMVTNEVVKNFNQSTILTLPELAQKLRLPPRLVNRSAENLVLAGILVHADDGNLINGYHPAKPVEQLNEAAIFEALDKLGVNHFPTDNTDQYKWAKLKIDKLYEVAKNQNS